MDKSMHLVPRLSEKTFGLSQTGNVYTFNVPAAANKHGVARAVAAQFEVTVETVNIANVKGKTKRTVRKGGRAVNGKRSDIKKAYVTLKAGETLPIFGSDETEADDAKKPKRAKAKEEKK